MAFLDACKFTPAAGGTSSFVVSANVAGYMTPAQAGAIDQATYHYRAESADLTQWEIGIGTYTASTGTLTRSIVLYNSLGTSAQINFSAAPAVGIVPVSGDFRIHLTNPLTLYVSTTGSDSNNGLAPSSPFLTIQHAINAAIATYDSAGQTITIQLAAGTYNFGGGTLSVYSALVGGGLLVIQGDTTNMNNVVWSGTSTLIQVSTGGNVQIQFVQFQAGSTGNGIQVLNGGTAYVYKVNFGTCGGNGNFHVMCYPNGTFKFAGDYTISGSTGWHIANIGGYVWGASLPVTLTGTPNFVNNFILAQGTGQVNYYGNTYSGSATGTRYLAMWNGVIQTNGQAATLPGSVAGSTNTGGIIS